MKNMTARELKQIKNDILRIFEASITDEYAKKILNDYDEITEETFMDSVINNVMETSDWEKTRYYNYDDIRLAIGRELIARIGIDD